MKKLELEALRDYIKNTPAKYRTKARFHAFKLGYFMATMNTLIRDYDDKGSYIEN
jgi:hypothetical protein